MGWQLPSSAFPKKEKTEVQASKMLVLFLEDILLQAGIVVVHQHIMNMPLSTIGK